MSVPRFKTHQYDGRTTGRRRRHPDDGHGTEPLKHLEQQQREKRESSMRNNGWGAWLCDTLGLKNALIVWEKQFTKFRVL